MAVIGLEGDAPPRGPAATDVRPDLEEVADLLDRALPGASVETRRVLARTGRPQRVLPDGLIMRQGETAPLTLIVRGYGAFRRSIADGGQHIIGLCARGALFGFSGIASVESTVDCVALTRAHAVQWSGREVRPLVAGDPGLALDVIGQMARFLMMATERLDGFLYQDTRRRVLRVLIDYGDLFFREPAILSRGHLPSLVGTTREMTGRVLRGLEREGLIARVGRRGLTLLSAEGLERAFAQPAGERAERPSSAVR